MTSISEASSPKNVNASCRHRKNRGTIRPSTESEVHLDQTFDRWGNTAFERITTAHPAMAVFRNGQLDDVGSRQGMAWATTHDCPRVIALTRREGDNCSLFDGKSGVVPLVTVFVVFFDDFNFWRREHGRKPDQAVTLKLS